MTHRDMDLRTLAFAMVAVLACAEKAGVDMTIVLRVLRDAEPKKESDDAR